MQNSEKAYPSLTTFIFRIFICSCWSLSLMATIGGAYLFYIDPVIQTPARTSVMRTPMRMSFVYENEIIEELPEEAISNLPEIKPKEEEVIHTEIEPEIKDNEPEEIEFEMPTPSKEVKIPEVKQPVKEPIDKKEQPTQVSELTNTLPLSIDNKPPNYPKIAKKRGYEGEVKIELEIDASGNVIDAKVVKSSGFDILNQSAVEAVKKWKFIPAQINGIKVTSKIVVPIEFKLTDK